MSRLGACGLAWRGDVSRSLKLAGQHSRSWRKPSWSLKFHSRTIANMRWPTSISNAALWTSASVGRSNETAGRSVRQTQQKCVSMRTSFHRQNRQRRALQQVQTQTDLISLWRHRGRSSIAKLLSQNNFPRFGTPMHFNKARGALQRIHATGSVGSLCCCMPSYPNLKRTPKPPRG